MRRLVKWGLVVAIWGLVALGGLFAWYAYDLPEMDRLAPASGRVGVRLVTADGVNLAHFGELRAEPVTLAELPTHLAQAVLATEDRRFYDHPGFDVRAVARAMLANIGAGRVVQGGSTLTQQLAKNLFLTPERSLKRKMQELLLAIQLERRFTKDEILTLYLNRVYLGGGSIGVEAAARNYFDKSARDVTLAEAAMLAGLLKAPTRYAPTRDFDRSAARSAVVLDNMVEAGFIDARTAAAAKASPPRLHAQPGSGGRYFADWVMARIGGFLSAGNGDLTVVTTLDSRLQRVAEASMSAVLEGPGKEAGATQGALVALSPDGAVRAMVGGRDYNDSQFNRAVQAQRQPGSAFKPFVYLAAIEASKLTADTIRLDEPVSIGAWRPRNYGDRYLGEVTAREALAKSLNSVAVRLTQDVGVDRVIDTARRLGVTSPLRREVGIALGSSEVNLLELTGAYGVFANGGKSVWPFGVREIRDGSGKVVFRRLPAGPGRLIGEEDLYIMNDMLSAVIIAGTGKAADIGRPAAGKTGTNEDFRDAWFIGYSADMVAGVWVGNDDGAPMQGVTGSGLPVQLWREFMIEAHQGLAVQPLPGREPSFLDRLRRNLFGG